jgi:hypothetical protein
VQGTHVGGQANLVCWPALAPVLELEDVLLFELDRDHAPPHHQSGPTHRDVPPSSYLLATLGHSGTCCARSRLSCPPPAGKKEKTP